MHQAHSSPSPAHLHNQHSALPLSSRPQRFLALVLLPRVRQEIAEKQKLHFALFMALKKATYKPGAFYKGLLLPLCASRSCTLREAVVFSSVLKRTSIPVLHSAAALLRMVRRLHGVCLHCACMACVLAWCTCASHAVGLGAVCSRAGVCLRWWSQRDTACWL